jgi:hypothetical protein
MIKLVGAEGERYLGLDIAYMKDLLHTLYKKELGL